MHQLDCENKSDEGDHGSENSGRLRVANNSVKNRYARLPTTYETNTPHTLGREFASEVSAFLNA